MIADIESEVAYTRHMIGKDKFNPLVMDAMATVPREAFVPDNLKHRAFDNGPLPIGHGQTISQPYIVALMTDLLEPRPDHTILEIGTGSGYQSAILSQLCKTVYSVELVKELNHAAADRLEQLGYDNVVTCNGNGYEGWPEHAPYDGIIVTAAAPYIPEALVEQLRPGGRMIIPLGPTYTFQELVLITKDDQGNVEKRSILGVAFVPLVNPQPGNDTTPG
jgi:protein-L-isoaspartate(D-aspartate) O-methyltransferase